MRGAHDKERKYLMQQTETPSGNDEDVVVRFLKEHPDFFENYPELLAAMYVTHAHGGRAISLQERQLEVLRERNRTMELKLAELIRIGQENDAISDKMQRWTRELLLETDSARLATLVVEGMSGTFSVPQVALRLWGLRESYRRAPFAATFAAPVDVDVITLANGMRQPYCGANADFMAAVWLPGGGAETRSIALLPLRKGADPEAFGLLVLGSADADRFRAGMGTAYLERIAELASAALLRLVE